MPQQRSAASHMVRCVQARQAGCVGAAGRSAAAPTGRCGPAGGCRLTGGAIWVAVRARSARSSGPKLQEPPPDSRAPSKRIQAANKSVLNRKRKQRSTSCSNSEAEEEVPNADDPAEPAVRVQEEPEPATDAAEPLGTPLPSVQAGGLGQPRLASSAVRVAGPVGMSTRGVKRKLPVAGAGKYMPTLAPVRGPALAWSQPCVGGRCSRLLPP